MVKNDEIIPKAQQIIIPGDELAVMAELSDSVAFVIIKRIVRRYIENMKNMSYMLDEDDPKFINRHIRHKEQGIGMNILIKVIADARSQLEKMEKGEQ